MSLARGLLRFSSRTSEANAYAPFLQIDGSHPLKTAVPAACIEYAVREKPGGQVAYFNFALAKEMGLLPKDHPEELNPELEKILLSTFALQIINEYDEARGKQFDPKTIKPNRYMATRYLQLQHPNKRGTTSGDGRSIWNGCVKHEGKVWDVSSCGTGATRLSPATAIHKKFFRTGDPWVAYGCGFATLSEGFNAALMSEIFHKNGVPTERTLALISFGKNSINVRAAPNLLRPSHIFRFLKQGDYKNLEKIVEYFVDRQTTNGKCLPEISKQKRLEKFTETLAEDFAYSTARFETDYIFCWMDWDGDNILADGAGIIDYGSVRQFGLYHKEYRYDDVDRFSTTIAEQKFKARYTVQTFAQIVDFLNSGRKKNLDRFKSSQAVKKFEKEYNRLRKIFLLERVGLSSKNAAGLLRKYPQKVSRFEKEFRFFEERQSRRGKYETSDGLTSDALFSMRDILRELPKIYSTRVERVSPDEFMQLGLSTYATGVDRKLTPKYRKKIKAFQKYYTEILHGVADLTNQKFERILLEVLMRSSILNPYARITGDGIIRVSDYVLRNRNQMDKNELLKLVNEFFRTQTTAVIEGPLQSERIAQRARLESSLHALKILTIVSANRESL